MRITSTPIDLRPEPAVVFPVTDNRPGDLPQQTMRIRPADPNDGPAIWEILAPTIRAGETYALDRHMSEVRRAGLLAGRRPEDVRRRGQRRHRRHVLPAREPGRRWPAHLQLRLHDGPAATGRGVARAMCLHSMESARELGYRGMQFNFVVEHQCAGRGAVAVARLRGRGPPATGVSASIARLRRCPGDVSHPVEGDSARGPRGVEDVRRRRRRPVSPPRAAKPVISGLRSHRISP